MGVHIYLIVFLRLYIASKFNITFSVILVEDK